MHYVLIADDEVMLRAVAAEALADAGFIVIQAGNGREALSELRANSTVALLISDIRMPGMDGCALVEAALAIRPELKILLITGYAMEPQPAAIGRHGLEVLQKPFNLRTLCQRARELTKAADDWRGVDIAV